MKSHRIWGYNLKHIILAVFVLLLVGCNQNEKFSKADNLEFAAKTHFTMSNVVISAGGNNSNISANNTLNFSGHNENILKTRSAVQMKPVLFAAASLQNNLTQHMMISLTSGISILLRSIMLINTTHFR